MKYFDSHTHIHFPDFDADRDAVLERMRETETGGVLIGTDLETSRAAIELAEQHDFLWAAVGLHPNDNPSEVFDEAAFAELAAHPKVVGIGECGLDYFRLSGNGVFEHAQGTENPVTAQRERFEAQIALAARAGKPLVIHCRNAHDDMLAMLAEAKRTHGDRLHIIMHFFTVSGEIAKKYIELDCHLSFPGPVTYTDMYDDSIRFAPADRILSETDSPFAAPAPFRGKRNESSYVHYIVEKIAAVRGEDLEVVRERILENSRQIFQIS